MDNTYLDVKIRLFESRGELYPAEIVISGEREFRGAVAAHILPWVASGDPAEDGQRLFDTLFADANLRAAWAEARGASTQRRIRLLLDAPELNAIPWELLRDAGHAGALAANRATPFSRYLPVSAAWGQPVQTRPLRVLAVIANPEDLEDYNLAPLDVTAERAALEAALAESTVHLRVMEPPVTLARIEAALQEGYHILHYVGHGMFSARRQQAALYMQDAQGMTAVVREEPFAAMLARQSEPPRLVLLMACQSATRATADAFRGLGPSLVKVGVPAVVAMQDQVAVAAARQFGQAFYRSLAQHGTVDLAMNAARSALLTDEHADAAVPVLFMRMRAGQLWAAGEESAPGAPAPARPDMAELRWYFAELRDDLAGDAPALAQVTALEAVITAEPPDVAAMRAIHAWFSAERPSLAGKLLNYVILHPITQALLTHAGDPFRHAHREVFIDKV